MARREARDGAGARGVDHGAHPRGPRLRAPQGRGRDPSRPVAAQRDAVARRRGQARRLRHRGHARRRRAKATRAQSAPTGSFPYMSPEQVRREPLTGQTDLFSVGVLLWEMLAGQRLFARTDADATLAAVLRRRDPAAVDACAPRSRRKLDEVVMRALERDQERALAERGRHARRAQQVPLLARRDARAARRRGAGRAVLPARDAAAADARRGARARGAGRRQRAGAGPAPTEAAPPPVQGPRTAVIPRDAAAAGQAPQRQKTFATHVDSKTCSSARRRCSRSRRSRRDRGRRSRSGPRPTAPEADNVPEADVESSARSTHVACRARERTAPPVEAPTAADRRGMIAPSFGSRAAPASRAMLVVIGLGGLALAAARSTSSIRAATACWPRRSRRCRMSSMHDRRRCDRHRAADAMPRRHDAMPPAPMRRQSTPDARSRCAPRDARGIRRADAARTARRRRGRRRHRDARDRRRPVGRDLRRRQVVGRTPRKIQVSAGHHIVEIVFPAETPPRKQTFAVDLGPARPSRPGRLHELNVRATQIARSE